MRRTPRPHPILLPALAAILTLALAAPAVAGGAAGFGDVEDDRYYTEAVAWLVGEGITTGVEAGCFGPDLDLTRGQVAAFLYRLDSSLGNNPATADHPFEDVTASYQQTPVGWLYGSGLTTGVSADRFAPYRSITRGDFAVLVWRYAGEPRPSSPLPFTDVIRSYQRDAVAWMAEEGITTGTSTTTFTPDGAVSRAEAATFFFRFVDPDEVAPVDNSGDCTRPLRVALELGGLTTTEAQCAAPFLAGFEIEYLVDVVADRADASFDLILAAVEVANRCLTEDRLADLSRLFL
jgi:S-layer homology domain